jgi:hypothetical protein
MSYCQNCADLLRERDQLRDQLAALQAQGEVDGCHGLDTPERVRFYEHDFYPLSNFSAFRVTVETKDRS